jgi:TonB family protein
MGNQEDVMLNTLLESRFTRTCNRDGAIVSIGFHVVLIAAAMYATASGATAARERVDPPTIRWVTTPPRVATAAILTPRHSAHGLGSQVTLPPAPLIELDLASTIPPVNITLQPIGPSDLTSGLTRASAAGGRSAGTELEKGGRRAYAESEVETSVVAIAGTIRPEYPVALRSRGIEGQVVAEFVVSEAGRAATETLRIISSTNDAFAEAVRRALPRMQFRPARLDGRGVPQLVRQMFVFRLDR